MNKTRWNRKTGFLCLATLLTAGIAQFASIISANNTAQTLPFNQNWTNTALITANDDWSNVPGIVGYLGDIAATSTTNVDPRTLLADYSTVSAVDVIANQTNPDTQTSGGVGEFEIANPTVALQGSGTADAPHIIIYLSANGRSNIKFAANIRDIDASADDAVQQVDVQYRVGATGDFTSIPGGYIADATTAGTATQVTPLNLTLPAAANNQAQLQIRVITTNAVGSDEWIGIDDLIVTGDTSGGGTPTPTPTTPTPTPTTPTPTPVRDANVDMNGDGKSDWVITRNANGVKTWWVGYNGTLSTSDGQFGLPTDIATPEDFDGDNKDDLAVWRAGAQSTFYVYQSASNTVRIENFGITGDDPSVVGDFDGDNRADPAVYRKAATGTGQNFFYYLGSNNHPNRNITYVPWGGGPNVRPHSGDFDGDGKNDFSIYTQAGQFIILRSSNFAVEYINWGIGTEALVPGDFDGDGRSDFCVVRNTNNQLIWYILERDGGGTGAAGIPWGGTGDVLTPGDYDGDGRQDVAIWRGNATPSVPIFYVRQSSNNALLTFQWGQQNDAPSATWYVHEAGAF